jgi:REP element-mobilizing transposase RayT
MFHDDRDRTAFLRELARVTQTYGWTCLAFCLLGTHYHLIVVVHDESLPIGMQSLNFRYAVGFNKRHGRRGHTQFDRYGSRRINGEADLLTTYRYVAFNPVDAGLCDSPEAWIWSAYAGTVGLAEPHSFVDAALALSCFEGSREHRIARLRAFVERR